jgi:CDP-diacylglycerol--serine O-phosphatidyltransferase
MKHVPNLITCLNLLAGCFACVMSLKFNDYAGAFIFIAMAAVFDFLDGLAARVLRAYSRIGAELDSLADVVSFGLAPGCIVYAYLSSYSNVAGFPLMAFLLPLFAALRLAKFNTDERQREAFLGLPVPASGLFWGALIPSVHVVAVYFPIHWTLGAMVFGVIGFCVLMMSEMPMFSLKFKNLRWSDNRWPFLLIGAAAAEMIVFWALGMALLGVSAVILTYIIMSAIKTLMDR